jgi:hypothetical protein
VNLEILKKLPALARRYRAGEMTDAAFAALYFLHWQITREGAAFASRRHKADAKPNAAAWLAELDALSERALSERLHFYLTRYQFRSVVEGVPVALAQWLCGAWPLTLVEQPLSPGQMLARQARGSRAVTVIPDFPQLLQPVLTKPDAFVFFTHDLEHAYKFFHDRRLFRGQQHFFERIEHAWQAGAFSLFLNDKAFTQKFYYLVSDMNTHPMHSLQYLRAILVEHFLRAEGKGGCEALSEASQRKITEALCTLEFSDGAESAAA